MLHIYICDDISEQAENIRQIISTLTLLKDWDVMIHEPFSTPEELLNTLTPDTMPGLYFLDIELHASMDGLQLAQQIRQKDTDGFLVFVTTHDEYIAATFQYQLETLDFIIKDSPTPLQESVRRVLNTSYTRYLERISHRPDLIYIKSGTQIHILKMEEILYAESITATHQTRIHTVNAQFTSYETLNELSKRLNDSFVFCHRSYLVNTEHISTVDRKCKMLVLDNGKGLPVSSRQLNKISDSFIKRMETKNL